MLSELKAFYRREVEPILGQPVGASARELEELEAQLGVELPAAYRGFLAWMGKDYRGAFVGTDCFISHVLGNNEGLPQLLSENELGHAIPERFLCFYMHQGYVAAWFDLPAGSDDPECWFFSEASELNQVQRVSSLTAFLLDDLRALLPAIRQVHGVSL